VETKEGYRSTAMGDSMIKDIIKVIKIIIGLMIMMVGLWVPFYIWDRVFPDDYVSMSAWYEFPLLMTLIFGGLGYLVIGVFSIANTISPLKERKR
jgi:hypothetical protein